MPEHSDGNSQNLQDRKQFDLKRYNIAYQSEDASFIDYELFPQFQLQLRGPAWDPKEPADLNAVGSARVFGRYLENPFPNILSHEYGFVCRNIGFAGCTPSAIYENDSLLRYLRESKAIPIVQVGAGDGAQCDWFAPSGYRRSILKADDVRASNRDQVVNYLQSTRNCRLYCDMHGTTFKELMSRISEGGDLPLELPTGLMARGGQLLTLMQNTKTPLECLEQVIKCQDWIVEEYKKLTLLLGRPAILLYFSSKPTHAVNEHNIKRVVKDFPQFVDKALVRRISPLFEETIILCSKAGLPYLQPGTNPSDEIHSNYPSQEMHRLCAEKIAMWFFSRTNRLKQRDRRRRQHGGSESENRGQ